MPDVVPLFDGVDEPPAPEVEPEEEEFTPAQRLLIDLGKTAEEALDSDVWTPEFWETMTKAEKTAHEALGALWEASEDGTFCTCEVCITRTVLQAIMPTITTYVEGAPQD